MSQLSGWSVPKFVRKENHVSLAPVPTLQTKLEARLRLTAYVKQKHTWQLQTCPNACRAQKD